MELHHRLKRLLDTDRTLGRNPRSADPEQAFYAFYAGDAPGSGVEVWFSAYEAFALLIAFNLLESGFPQQQTVLALRRKRPALEQEHKRILKLDPEILSNLDSLEAKPTNKDPAYLSITTERLPKAKPLKATRICHGYSDLMQFMKSALASYTVFELTRPARWLNDHLAKTEPSQRGRAAS
jgi:hypothetical protein